MLVTPGYRVRIYFHLTGNEHFLLFNINELLADVADNTMKNTMLRKSCQLLAPQRTCVTGRHFRENVAPGTSTPHFCAFVDAPMAERHLRVDCAEHETAV
jgi:hypothetical protein